MRATVAFLPSAVLLAAVMLSGCYLRHGLGDFDAGRDAAIGRDATVDAGVDAGRPRCCSLWLFDRRLTIDAFDERSVTPRLVELGGRPAVVVTGPSDPTGPSGAHLVPLEPDLAAYGAPTPVTRGSFTWGQPASSGDRVAVCWGNGDGNVVRSRLAAAPTSASCATRCALGSRAGRRRPRASSSATRACSRWATSPTSPSHRSSPERSIPLSASTAGFASHGDA